LAKVDHEDRSAAERCRALPGACRAPAGRFPDVLEPGFHYVRTHWIRGFMAFQLARCTRIVMLTVPE
jgi:hypothetical protein